MAGVSGLRCGRSQASGGVMERGREGGARTRVPPVVTAGHCTLGQCRVKLTAPVSCQAAFSDARELSVS